MMGGPIEGASLRERIREHRPELLAAAAIVRRGRATFESDPVAQFGAEAVVGRIGDAASKPPEEVRAWAGPDPVAGVGRRWFNAGLGSARRCWWPAFVCANTST
jgi:hypothetical protein